ncbi:hypothetical protein WUBG_15206, partial [Wuchereria bancrofti]
MTSYIHTCTHTYIHAHIRKVTLIDKYTSVIDMLVTCLVTQLIKTNKQAAFTEKKYIYEMLFVSVFYCLLIIVISKQAITDKDGKATDIRANLTTLIYVHAMWRHGDRTPINLLPNDNKESWEIGLGELT